ncbi:MAG: septum formation initiator family protein [Opitutales bacterium]|jgi:cell division protein FtsB
MNGKKLLWITMGCLQLGVLVFFGYRLFEEYRELEYRESQKSALEHEKNDLHEKIERRRDFLDRLARDPEFQDAVVRRELGYGKEGETIYHFPSPRSAPSLVP